MRLALKGNFVGIAGSQYTNADIPTSAIPENLRDKILDHEVREGVGQLEALAAAEGGELRISMSADLAAAIGGKAISGMNCMQVWAPVSVARMRGVLDIIRTRVLEFVLDIESLDPDAGEAEGTEPPVPVEQVAQVFHTNIFGGQNVAIGTKDVQQYADVVPGDMQSLARALRAVGLGDDLVLDLERALADDRGDNDFPVIGPETTTWLTKVRQGVQAGTLMLAGNAAGSVIADLVLRFAGVS